MMLFENFCGQFYYLNSGNCHRLIVEKDKIKKETPFPTEVLDKTELAEYRGHRIQWKV